MIRFFCPTCRAKVQAPDDNAGRTGRCPACQGTFVVPAASAADLAQSVSTFGNEIPAVPIPQSTRPASPFDVFGNGQTPQTPPAAPAEIAQQEAPLEAASKRPRSPIEVPTPEEVEAEDAEAEAKAAPPPPRAKASTGWLPLALAGAGGLLILITIIVGVMGRKSSQSVAVDSGGNALPDQNKAAPRGQIEIKKIIPTTLPETTQPAVAAPTRNPLTLVPKTSGEKQSVFDPPPQIANPTTRPVVAAKQMKTAQSLVTPVQVNDTIYFAARDGSFYSIKTGSLEWQTLPKLIEPVHRLMRDGTKLKADSLQAAPQTAIDFGTSIDSMDPENMDPSGTATKLNGKSLPNKFRQHLTPEKQVVLYQDKFWRPLSGGTIKVLEGGHVTEYTSEVVGIGFWKIALLPQGPLGYDNTSVYALDEHLCPTKRLINVDPDVGRWSQARVNSFLASNEKTLCFVSAYNNKARMMIWSPHGSKKFREVPVTYNETATTEGNRLALLGDGYLFCGGEITWLPIGNGAPVRFTTQAVIAAAAQQPSLRAQRRTMTVAPSTSKVPNFTPPVVTAQRIFVGHASGSVYVFETRTFAGSSTAASDTATTSP